MRWLFPLLFALSACDTPTEQLAGQLVQVTVITTSDTCTPQRVSGDGGLQFWALRPDGGAIFSASLYSQLGPSLDGGDLGASRLNALPMVATSAAVGGESDCLASLAGWSFSDAGLGVQLEQTFPGIDGCPSGPSYLPAASCAATRQFLFTPVRDCSLSCVRVSGAGDVTCAC
jgi:hypothetical protein